VHLKSLTVKGFKSFAEPTSLHFEPGVTCVVGPNGSGKSNVVDALAWVMGEQGAKSLRGGSMEDVIFAGTQSRGPLGRAEVSLTIDNADNALPIDYTEVTISRTLFRNGQSEYAINREPCRLLDVQELLSDTGLGREMHVIVGQGQLDRILYASADDRRRFIEEAAGIMKHRRRKEKTVRKLEAMEANLTRLQDLVTEIRRQLKPLGRQAEVAREAQTIQAVVRDARARLLADDLHTLQAELAQYHASEGASASERALIQSELTRVQAEREAAEAGLTSPELDQARTRDFDIKSVTERIRSLHSLALERVNLLGQEEAQLSSTQTVSDEDIALATEQVELAAAALATAEVELGDMAAATATARARLESFDETLEQDRQARDRWERAQREHREALAVATSKREAAEADLTAAREAVDSADQRIQEVDRHWSERSHGDNPADQALASAESVLQEAWRQEADAGQALELARVEAHRLEREKDALAATVQTLSLALEAQDASPVTGPGVHGRVSDLITITPGFETAIARALGVLAEALVVSTRQSAYDLSRQVSGKTDSLVSMVVDEAESSREPLELEGLTPASQVVEGPIGVRRLLERVFIASNLEEVHTHWVGHPELPADVHIVTTAGDVFHGSQVHTGSGAQRSSVELLAERDQASSKLQSVSTQVERQLATLAECEAALERAKEQVKERLAAVRGAEAERAQRSEELSGLAATLESARAERERAQSRVDRASEALERAEHELAGLSAADQSAEPQPTPRVSAEDRAERVQDVEQARASEVEARVLVEQARSALGYQREQVDTLRARQVAEQEEAARETERAARRRELHRQAVAVSKLSPALLQVAETTLEQSQQELIRLGSERAQREQSLQQLRTQESELRERVTKVTDAVHSLEMHIYERNLQLTQLVERARDELGVSADTLLAEYGPDQLVPAAVEGEQATAFDRAEQEKRLRTAEKALDALGRVNPLALDEFQALEQRHQFLVEQLEDVHNSKRDLLAIVDDLDETMRDVFMEAYSDTQRAFDEVFPILFPGGQGSLSLSDPDNPLTTGVEVAVRPRGKKIERLSLLSGGERSLAAVALLIAIFIARPSPFYILDEVEAALDDANLGRLLQVMEKLRADSQLIIITHQKRTMEIADALYGVSMRDDGVSAVVGQRVRDEALSA